MDVEYISLHGYIRNTPQTQKCLLNTSSKRTGRPDQRKGIYRTTRKELGGETGVLVELDLPSAGGGSRGQIPTSGQLSESEERYLRLRMKQLISGSLNGKRIRPSLPQLCIPWTGTWIPWEVQRMGAGVWGGCGDPRARAAADSRETYRGEVREEIVMGNGCGGKPGSHGSKAILLSHAERLEPLRGKTDSKARGLQAGNGLHVSDIFYVSLKRQEETHSLWKCFFLKLC